MIPKKRIKIVETVEEAFELVCFGKKKYTAMLDFDEVLSADDIPCELDHTGFNYYENWISSTIVRGSKYKRPVDKA